MLSPDLRKQLNVEETEEDLATYALRYVLDCEHVRTISNVDH